MLCWNVYAFYIYFLCLSELYSKMEYRKSWQETTWKWIRLNACRAPVLISLPSFFNVPSSTPCEMGRIRARVNSYAYKKLLDAISFSKILSPVILSVCVECVWSEMNSCDNNLIRLKRKEKFLFFTLYVMTWITQVRTILFEI